MSRKLRSVEIFFAKAKKIQPLVLDISSQNRTLTRQGSKFINLDPLASAERYGESREAEPLLSHSAECETPHSSKL